MFLRCAKPPNYFQRRQEHKREARPRPADKELVPGARPMHGPPVPQRFIRAKAVRFGSSPARGVAVDEPLATFSRQLSDSHSAKRLTGSCKGDSVAAGDAAISLAAFIANPAGWATQAAAREAPGIPGVYPRRSTTAVRRTVGGGSRKRSRSHRRSDAPTGRQHAE